MELRAVVEVLERSLSSRRAWIEITGNTHTATQQDVALLTESVD